MAGQVTDEEAQKLMPAVWELVQLVAERDGAGVQAALEHTPPSTLAVLAAGWVEDLMQDGTRAAGHFKAVQAVHEAQRKKDTAEIAHLKQVQADQADMIAQLKTSVRELGGSPR